MTSAPKTKHYPILPIRQGLYYHDQYKKQPQNGLLSYLPLSNAAASEALKGAGVGALKVRTISSL